MRRKLLNLFVPAILFVPAVHAFAQDAPPDAAQPPAAADTTIQVLEVKGNAEFRNAPDREWQALKTDSQLTVGAEVKTALRSSVKLRLGANSEVEVKSLTTVAIADLSVSEEDQAIRTRVSKKYGTMRAKVHKVGDLNNDYKISTPSAVLAIRGTEWEHGEFGSSWDLSGLEGSFVQQIGKNQFVLFPGDDTDDDNPNPNDPPTGNLLLGGQSGSELNNPGQSQLQIREGTDSFNSSLEQAEEMDRGNDPGGEDGEGDGKGGGNEVILGDFLTQG